MSTRTTNDVALTICGTCAIACVGAAIAAGIYLLIAAAVPLVETLMSQRLPM